MSQVINLSYHIWKSGTPLLWETVLDNAHNHWTVHPVPIKSHDSEDDCKEQEAVCEEEEERDRHYVARPTHMHKGTQRLRSNNHTGWTHTQYIFRT